MRAAVRQVTPLEPNLMKSPYSAGAEWKLWWKCPASLAAVRATSRLFRQISADTKDLCDIPQFWPQAQRWRLPLVEYTAREVRSGLLFWAFAQKRSASASAVFAARKQHLDRAASICATWLAN
jgi:hypothetical protein